jgi:hypothetical protein
MEQAWCEQLVKNEGSWKIEKRFDSSSTVSLFDFFSSGKLLMHFQSNAHAASVNRLLNFKSRRNNIDSMICANRRQAEIEENVTHQFNRKIVLTLFDSALFLARQGLAFRNDPKEEGIFTDSSPFQQLHL